MHLLVLAALMITGVKTYTTPELGLMAASEFVTMSTDENWAKIEPWHKKALVHFKSESKSELKKELEPVYKKYGLLTMEGCGAVYVMALHGVDLETNTERLRKAFTASYSKWEHWTAVPEALADVYLRNGNTSALKALVMSESDGHGAETQSSEVSRVFGKKPLQVALFASKSTQLWDAVVEHLSFGYEDGKDNDLDPVTTGFRKLKASKDPKIRALGIRLKKSVAKVSQ